MDTHCFGLRYSSRKSNPESAPTAGCKLIRMPNVFEGICRNAPISSVKGIALVNRATAIQINNKGPFTAAKPPLKIPKGKTKTVAKIIPTATASPPFISLETFPPKTM